MQWQVQTPGKFYDQDEPSVVYFDPHSGDTHLITAFAACIVRALLEEAQTIEQLCQQLLAITDSETPEQLAPVISAALDELHALDIVRPCN